MPLITFWSKCLGDDDIWIGLFLPSMFATTKILHGIAYEKSAFYKTFYSNLSVCALNNKCRKKGAPVVGSM